MSGTDAPTRVLVAGAGTGGLEAVLALQAHAPVLDVTLLAPERHFTVRPLDGSPGLRVELARVAADRGFAFVRDALDRVEPGDRRVTTQGGAALVYDALVLALGARPVSVPGALTFRGPADADRLSAALDALDRPRVFITSGCAATPPLVLCELALLVAGQAPGAEVAVVGTVPDEQLTALLSGHGIAVAAAATGADLVIATPALAGPAISGLPHDAHGFVAVDEHCRVEGVEHVYAIGDMAAQAVKRAGLAAQRADVAARAIAAWAGAPVDSAPYVPELRWPRPALAGAHLAPYLAANGALLGA